jgi:hypothetical protein
LNRGAVATGSKSESFSFKWEFLGGVNGKSSEDCTGDGEIGRERPRGVGVDGEESSDWKGYGQAGDGGLEYGCVASTEL